MSTKKTNIPSITFIQRLKKETTGSQAMVILTALIALFSLIVACISVYQISVYWKAVKIENRAYLALEFGPAKIKVGGPISASYKITNTGKTPAINLLPYHATIFWQDVPDSLFTIVKASIERHDRQGFITGTSVPINKDAIWDGVLTVQDSIDYYSGQKNIFLLGAIRYYDRFDERHYTWFCVAYRSDGTYYAYPKYNDAD
jgi:hypothetical protein